jgi:hypothetical protein
MEEALVKINNWSILWQLPFSLNKSAMLLFSGNLDLVPGKNLALNDFMLEVRNNTIDLGVTFQRDLKFTTRIENICSKANQRLYILRKRIISSDPTTLILAYKMYVLPILFSNLVTSSN